MSNWKWKLTTAIYSTTYRSGRLSLKKVKIFIVGNFFSHIIYVSMKKGEPEISIFHLKEETK